MSVRVKICGLTRGSDVRYAVRAGVDALGFVFAPRSSRVLDSVAAAGLVREVPAFVTRVGLFMDQDAETITRVLEQVPLNLLQFHGAENAAFCQQFGLPYVKAVSMKSTADAQTAQAAFGDAAALLLDSHPVGGVGGTGVAFDWRLIPEFDKPLVLAGGLTVHNVRQAVEQVQPWAVDVSSGVESAPGIKNEALMSEFIKEAKREH